MTSLEKEISRKPLKVTLYAICYFDALRCVIANPLFAKHEHP